MVAMHMVLRATGKLCAVIIVNGGIWGKVVFAGKCGINVVSRGLMSRWEGPWAQTTTASSGNTRAVHGGWLVQPKGS